MKRLLRQDGQGMVAMVLMMTLIATGIGLFALEQSRIARKESVEYKRVNTVMATMNGVARWMHQVYYHEANCDPYIFNLRLNEMGSRVYSSRFGGQSLAINSGSNPAISTGLGVSVGALVPKPPSVQTYAAPIGRGATAAPAPYGVAGYGPQDVSVTFWVTPYKVAGSVSNQGAVRYEQTVTLINTCSPRGASDYTGATPVPGFGQITDPTSFALAVQSAVPGSNTTAALCGTRARGSIDSDDAIVDVKDRDVFANYIRSGETAGVVDSTNCPDMNKDGMMNEVDLNLLDKTLKGYLYYNVPSYQQ